MSQASHQECSINSPFIQHVGRYQVETDGVSVLPADGHWYLFVMRQDGKARLAVGGPIAKVMYFPYRAGTDWLGIQFNLGTYLPHLPINSLLDGPLFLPEATSNRFWLNGSAWELPTVDNADVFVNRLVREQVLVRDPVVSGVLENEPQALSLRSVQRRFKQTIGLTSNTVRQIERAHYATRLLQQGVSILDTVAEAGYFDQPHLTRTLKHLFGQTPAQFAPVNASR